MTDLNEESLLDTLANLLGDKTPGSPSKGVASHRNNNITVTLPHDIDVATDLHLPAGSSATFFRPKEHRIKSEVFCVILMEGRKAQVTVYGDGSYRFVRLERRTSTFDNKT